MDTRSSEYVCGGKHRTRKGMPVTNFGKHSFSPSPPIAAIRVSTSRTPRASAGLFTASAKRPSGPNTSYLCWRPALGTAVCVALFATVFATVLLTSVAPVHAQNIESRDFPIERFRLSLDRQGVLNVEWAATQGHLSWDLSVWLGAADDPLVAYTRDLHGELQRMDALVAQRIGGHIVGSLGLWDNVEIGVAVPVILYQNYSASSTGRSDTREPLSRFALGDLRVATKIQLLRARDHIVDLAITPTFVLPSGQGQDYRGERALSYQPEIAISRAWRGLRMASNVGYRAREDTAFNNGDVADELFVHLGVGYRFHDFVQVPLEIDVALSAATQALRPLADASSNYLELLGGASWDLPGGWTPFVIGGTGLSHGFGTPDWRLIAGVRLRRGHR